MLKFGFNDIITFLEKERKKVIDDKSMTLI